VHRLALAAAPLVVAITAGKALAAGGGAPPVLKGPYLQRLASSEVEIRFELGSAAPASVLVAAAGQPGRTWTDATAREFHSVHVTGLAPASRYRYAVRVAGDEMGGGEFTTAPKDDAQSPASFVLYGDDRTDHAAHEAVVRAMQVEAPDFLVHTGDFVQQGGVPEYWQQFFEVERGLLADHCVFACVGNHELFEDPAAAHYEQYFGPSSGQDAKLYGTFRWGNARFFLLNAFESWTGDERSWLEGALKAADTEAGLGWRVAVIHQGPWSAGPHGDNKALLAAHVDDLLLAHHVDLVLAGHDHIYERGEAKGLKYVISGGGGAPLYTELSPQPSTRKVESAYHYVVFQLAAERVSLTAKRVDGSVIDQCGFSRGRGWDCDTKGNAATVAPTAATPTSPTQTAAQRCGCSTPGAPAPFACWSIVLAAAALAVGRRTPGTAGRRRSSRFPVLARSVDAPEAAALAIPAAGGAYVQAPVPGRTERRLAIAGRAAGDGQESRRHHEDQRSHDFLLAPRSRGLIARRSAPTGSSSSRWRGSDRSPRRRRSRAP
jgi:predicted phosphodiesterase